jgi:hypothetical protein
MQNWGALHYDEYDVLRENRCAAERTLLQGLQETNNRGAKAFRDKARELIMQFLVKGDSTKQQDEKYVHAMLSTFGFTGSTVLHHRHPAGHPVLLECMETPPPTERGELTASPPARPRPLVKRIMPYNSFTRLEDRLWNAGWMSAWS